MQQMRTSPAGRLRALTLAAQLFACLFLTLHPPALAGSHTASGIDCGKRPIRLAFYDYGFFYFEGEQRQAQGIDKDIIDELSRRPRL
ncbi:MAG: hypothetical protein HYZ45_04155 [Burkholderiales bacterium]|nr:hypothetical protein [Burkholderiales bacterium]